MNGFEKFEAKRQYFLQPPTGESEVLGYPMTYPFSGQQQSGLANGNLYAPYFSQLGGPWTSGGMGGPWASGGFGSLQASGGSQVGSQVGSLAARNVAAGQPLRVIHVTTCTAQGGIEQWLQSLIKFADPGRLKFVRCVVTSDYVDPHMAKSYRVPLEVGGRDSVLRACRDCDVLLVSDSAGMVEFAHEIKPPLCVMVAHGDGHWTRTRLEGMRPAVKHVVAVSDLVKKVVCHGFPTTVIHNGVDAARLSASMGRDAARAKFGFQPDDFVLGWVGRFSEEKNPAAVIDAIERLPPNFKVLMVGFGYLRAELMDLANERIPGRFAFVRRDEYLGDVYGAMDAFCLTSFSEGFGLVLVEAMLSGLPIVSTPVGLVHDVVVDRVNGLIVDGEPNSIRDAVLRLQQHSTWREGLAREARRWADQHGHASKMAQSYADLLWSLWDQRAATCS